MDIHDNSLEAFKTLDKASRQKMVLECYHRYPLGLTDRDVKDLLGFSDMNSVRPRVSEMIKEDRPRLEEKKKIRDSVTGRNVRVVWLAGPRKQGELAYG